MFNIGGGELIVILLIALIVLGPQRLPDAARQIGKTMGELRRLSSGFQNEMKQALETADDPKRIAARRNVLARETPSDASEGTSVGASELEELNVLPDPVELTADAAAESIAAVSGQPSAPPKKTPPSYEGPMAGKKEATGDLPERPPTSATG